MRRTAALIYLAIFIGEVVWMALVPLVPTYADRFGLGKLDAGVLLAAASLTILASSIPATLLSDRYGARSVTLVTVGLMAAADVVQGMAGSFWMLLAARLLFGIAFGTLWVSGVAWLAEEAGPKQARALSLTITTAGLGGIAGPAFAGVLVQRFGLAAPFLVCAAATAALVPAMLLAGGRAGGRVESVPPLLETIADAVRSAPIRASLILMGLGGLVGGAVNLLVPLQLHRNGLTSAGIGVAFSAAAVAFIASSAVVARFGERAARIQVGVASALLMSGALAILVASHETAAMIGFLLLRGPISALMFTITFPLGVVGARAAGVSLSAVAALLNMTWAGSALAGPLLAGFVTELTSARTTYVLVIALALTCAAVMSGARRAHEAADAPGRSHPVTGR
jgi:MFS transporter, DHA1 family, solute carrier family 18 (vesicular amine transporter), member 1/2